jgi:hypothetical protein
MTHEVKPECQLAIKEFVQLARKVMIIPPDLSAYPFISECPGGV